MASLVWLLAHQSLKPINRGNAAYNIIFPEGFNFTVKVFGHLPLRMQICGGFGDLLIKQGGRCGFRLFLRQA